MRRCRQAGFQWVLLVLLALVGWVTTTSAEAAAQNAANAAAKKNVILMVVDDMGCDAGCYGNSVLKTPHLDQLAKEGTLFTHAYCTTASCSASRSVILTGRYNHANGQYGHEHGYHHFRSRENTKSLPMMLAGGGYRTARCGKLHVGPPEVYPFDETIGAPPRNATLMADRCKSFIAEASDKPFFLYFCPTDPHRGGKRTDLPYEPDAFGNHTKGAGEGDEYKPGDVIVPPFLPDTPECRAELAQYYESVSRIDKGVGRLMEILKETGHDKDTLFVFLSDHGIAFPGGKTTVYDPGLRSPLIVRDPFVEKRGVVSDAMISWVDITPTVLDFAGVKAPKNADIQGRSFLPILTEEHPKGWDFIYASHTFHEVTMYYPMRVVQGRRYKLIWNIAHPLPYPFASDLWEAPTWQSVLKQGPDAMYGKRTVDQYIHRPEFELYDMQVDPNESNNLAVNGGHPSPGGEPQPDHSVRLDALKKQLREFQTKTSDPWVLKWDYE